MFSICEIKDGNDYIIEGYHVTPQLATRLIKKYGSINFHVLFIVKSDKDKFVSNIKKRSTPNDWILVGTHKKETFHKIAEMIEYYGQLLSKKTVKHGYKILNMDDNFDNQIKNAINHLATA